MKKLIPVLLVVVVLGAFGFKWYKHENPEKFPEPPAVGAAKEDNSSTSAVTSARKTANVTVDAPINGTMKGVIEVGASGFNSFVVLIDKDKNWELVSKEFGESLAYEGFATTEDVKLGLKKYLAAMFNKGVAGRNAHFVMSSGALKNPKTELIAKSIEQMGYVVNRVNAEQEGKFALKALLPKSYKDNSYTIDMGSGNTKISWYEGSNLKSVEASGAKYYQNGKTDQQVYEEIKNAVMEVPANKRGTCFIIGGIPYQLAKQVRTGNERFTILNNPDDYSAGDDVKLKSGLNIYRSVVDNAGTSTFIFDWDANFTIGFLLTLN